MMKKITQSFLTLLLLMVMGVVSANAKTEKVHATFASPSNTSATWNAADSSFVWKQTSYNQIRNIGLPSGDITKYKKLVVDCTMRQGTSFRILVYKGGSNITLWAKDGVNEFILADTLKVIAPNDYNSYLKECSEICLSGSNAEAAGEVKINDMYLETYNDEGDKVHATFASPSNTSATWNAADSSFVWKQTSYNQIRNIGLPSGDITKYKKLVVDCTMRQGTSFRILVYKGGSNITLWAKDGVNEFILADTLKVLAPNDYNAYLKECSEICLSGSNAEAAGEVKINDMYLETYPENESVEIPEIEYEEDPGKPEGDYIDFTEAFPELNPRIGIGEDTHPIVIGNGDVVVGQRTKNVIADLSAYSSMTLVTTPGLKMVIYMNHEIDAKQNAGEYTADDEGKYEFIEAQAGDDGLYTLDLTQYDKQDLNCIAMPWDNTNKGTVWYILLQEGEAPVATYAITIPETENGTVSADVEEAAEGDKVTLTITPAEGYELDELSVTAGETVVEVAEDNTFTMPAAEVTVTATFKESSDEPEPEPASSQDLTLDLFHLWTGFGADATIADPDNNSGACVVGEATGCPYGDSNVGELQFADLSAWDYLTLVVTSDAPRLFFNAKSQSDRISVLPNDEKYLISKEDGVYVYDLAAIKADAGYVHLNSIKASAWNTQITVSEMKLTLAEPEHEIADLAKDMFHKWTGFDAEATVADPDENGGGVNLNAETDCPYGNTNVTEYEYADLSAWDYLTLVVTSDNPRLFFNSKGGNDRITVLVNDEKYVKSNEDGVIVYDLAAIKADAGFVHLNSIKASAWNTKTIVTEMKLATVEPYIPEAEGEATTYAITIAATENGTVSADVEEAAEGDKVTLTITPAEGYELDELSVTAGETVVEVDVDNTFIMPAAAVTVTAAFKAVSVEPEPVELTYTDLTAAMFFQWSDFTDGEAQAKADCAYVLNEETGQPYGDPSVNNYADLTGYSTLEITTAAGAAAQPRILFNRTISEGQDNEAEESSNLIDMPKYAWSEKYQSVKENEDGSKTYIIDIAQIVADKGFAHLQAIKALGWGNTTIVTDMKLGYVGEQPVTPIPTAIEGVDESVALKDGKYIENGQIVIVKDGVKYNVAGQVIK